MCVQAFTFTPIKTVHDLSELDQKYFTALAGVKSIDQVAVADINAFVEGLVESEAQKAKAQKDEWEDGWVL